MIILKFGGTSVSTKKSLEAISKIVSKQKKNNPVVIVSALKGITDLLLSLSTSSTSNQITILQKIKKVHIGLIQQFWLSEKEKNIHVSYITEVIKNISSVLKTHRKLVLEFQDKIASYGEIMSSYIVCQVLRLNDISATQIIATELIVTNDNFGNAKFCPVLTKKKVISKLKPLINKNIIPVITGFIGSTRDGKVTTLGRGSSDYSASIVGCCLGAKEIQIWTDVDGIYSADPRIVKKAKILKRISYKLAEVFANSGAKVLCPKTIKPAVENKIPIRILNTFSPLSQGTSIACNEKIIKQHICGVMYKHLHGNQISVSIIGQNFKSKLFVQEIRDFLSGLCKQKVYLRKSDNYSCLFLIESNNPVGIVNALHNKYCA